jgi:hypothetical protein
MDFYQFELLFLWDFNYLFDLLFSFIYIIYFFFLFEKESNYLLIDINKNTCMAAK